MSTDAAKDRRTVAVSNAILLQFKAMLAQRSASEGRGITVKEAVEELMQRELTTACAVLK